MARTGTDLQQALPGLTSVYAAALGPTSRQLAPAVRALHCDGRHVEAAGHFAVRRGRGPITATLASVLRLPAAGVHVPLRLCIDRSDAAETWHRGFGDQPCLATSQRVVGEGRIEERVGRWRLALEVRAHEQSLELRQIGGGLRLGRMDVPLPWRLCPRTTAIAAPAPGGRVAVTVRVTLPRGRLLVSYTGAVDVVSWR